MLNPVLLTQIMRNPQAYLNHIMSNNQFMQNPIGRNAVEMYQKGDIQGLNQLANNLCKEKGTSLDEMTKKIKSQFNI
jgi:hypothetical protein